MSVTQTNITNDSGADKGRLLRFLYESDDSPTGLLSQSGNVLDEADCIFWAFTPHVTLSIFLHQLSSQGNNLSNPGRADSFSSIVSFSQTATPQLSDAELHFLAKFIRLVRVFFTFDVKLKNA